MTNDPVELLYYASRALWMSACIGNPPPATAELHQRMRNPRPGDLVIEISSFSRTFDPDSVGRLIRIEGESMTCPERHVVEPISRPGEEQGWQNAEFVALPDQRSSCKWAAPSERMSP